MFYGLWPKLTSNPCGYNWGDGAQEGKVVEVADGTGNKTIPDGSPYGADVGGVSFWV